MSERQWNYGNPVDVLFGCGRLREVCYQAKGHCLIVASSGATRRGLTACVQKMLGDRADVFDEVDANPDIESAQVAVERFAGSAFETVIAIGGGSVIDFGKILAVTIAHSELKIRQALENPEMLDALSPLRLVAIPTTAGTGSEVTPFATLWDHAEHRKYSLSSPAMYPVVAILDPELTLSLPWEATLAPGLDAFSQCFESIWNRNATPLTTAIARHGLSLIPDALKRLQINPDLIEPRTDMLESSLCSGLAISRTRTALAHSISYPVTAHFGMPHGLACAFTLPALLRFNSEADDGRLLEVASSLDCEDTDELVMYIVRLFKQTGVAESFRRYVPNYAVLYDLIPEMLTPGRADNNMRQADRNLVREILEQAQTLLQLE